MLTITLTLAEQIIYKPILIITMSIVVAVDAVVAIDVKQLMK